MKKLIEVFKYTDDIISVTPLDYYYPIDFNFEYTYNNELDIIHIIINNVRK